MNTFVALSIVNKMPLYIIQMVGEGYSRLLVVKHIEIVELFFNSGASKRDAEILGQGILRG